MGQVTGRERRTTRSARTPRTQVALGWLALGLVFAEILRAGGTAPAAWIFLCVVTLLLFAVQVVLDFRHGVPAQARRIYPVAILYFAVVVWLQLQATPGLPEALAHPAWALAPEGAIPTISIDPDSSRQVAMRLSCYAMVCWIVLRSAASSRRAEHLIAALALFSTGLALYGFFVVSTGQNPLLGLEETKRELRANFVNRNNYATFAVVGVLANVTMFHNSVRTGNGRDGVAAFREFLERFFALGWIFFMGALVGLAALAATGSRAGLMAGVIGLVVLFWALSRPARGSLRWGPVILAAVFGLLALSLAWMSGTLHRLAAAEGDIRFRVFPSILEGISERPLLGHGAGGFTDAFHAFVTVEAAQGEFQYGHNTFLENTFEFGLPAAAIFFAALALLGWRLLQGVLTRRRHQEIPAFALACFVAAIVPAAVSASLQIPAIAALFAAILGIGWARSFPEQRTTPSNPRSHLH